MSTKTASSFVPTFVDHPYMEGLGATWKMPLNNLWFATFDTANALSLRSNAKVVSVPSHSPMIWYRVTITPANSWYLQFDETTIINAAELAQTFLHYPEDITPGVADRINNQLIQMYKA